jgi:hypothetical protein
VEEVVEREQKILLAKVGNEFLDVEAKTLDFAVLRFVQPVNPEVHGVVELPKSGVDLFAGDEIVAGAQAFKQFEAAIDRIVVSNGDEVHPAALGRPVDIEGAGIAIPAAQKAEVLGPPRVKGVAVHVRLQQLVFLSLKDKMLY